MSAQAPRAAALRSAALTAAALTAAALTAAALTACQPSPRPELPRSGGPFVVPLVDAESHALYLEARIDGRGPWLVKVDTGAAHCSLARDVARELGIPPIAGEELTHVDANGMPTREAVGLIGRLTLGQALTLRRVRCLLPERPPRRYAGLRVVGLLGMNVLRGLALTVDRDRGLFIVDAGQGGARAAPRGALSIPIGYASTDRRMTRPSVPVWLLGRPLPFLLDTGAARTHVNARVGRALGLPIDRRLAAVRVAARSSRLIVGAFRAQRLWLGPISVRRPTLWPLRSSKAMPRAVSGLLGMDVLGRYNLTIDFRRSRLHLWPRLPAAMATGRLARWGGRVPACAREPGCLRFSRVRRLCEGGDNREGFVVQAKRPLERPLQALLRLSDPARPDGARSWLSASLIPAPGRRRWEVALPEVLVHHWDDPVIASGTLVELVDASPFTSDCAGPVCARWEARR